MDERNGHRVDVNQDDMASGGRAADLPEPGRNPAVYYPRKHLFISDECTIRFGGRTPVSSERTTLSRECTVATGQFRSQANCTPPPEYLLRPVSPEEEECEDSAESPWYSPQEPAQKHWLFAEEIQEVLRERCIPFHIQRVPASSPHVRLEGLTAKTVLPTKREIDPRPNEVVVSVVRGGKRFQMSINPSYLTPWAPAKGNRVVVIECCGIGQVGKLVELKDGSCTVKLDSSRKVSYFGVQEVVNIL